jgi:hypothetical protein
MNDEKWTLYEILHWMHLSRSQWNFDLGIKNQRGLKNNSLQLENLFF